MTLPITRIPDPHDAPALRWGILAPGGIARLFARAVHQYTRQRVVAVGSRSRDRAEAFGEEFNIGHRYDSYEALVADDDIDAIYVASPHSHHAEHARLVIEAGKHLLVEKAFTQTVDEARDVVAAARSAGVTCMEAMWTRFLPHVDVVRQLLADGALGEVEVVEADHGQYFDFDSESRLFNPALAGGAMLDLGVYPVSFASFVLGVPGRVRAVGTRAETGVDRQVSMILDDFEAQPDAHALVNTTLAAKTPTTATIAGPQARIEIPGEFYTPQQVRFITRDGAEQSSPVPRIQGHDGLAYEAAHFGQLVADGRLDSPLMPLDESITIMETMNRALTQIA